MVLNLLKPFDHFHAGIQAGLELIADKVFHARGHNEGAHGQIEFGATAVLFQGRYIRGGGERGSWLKTASVMVRVNFCDGLRSLRNAKTLLTG